MFQTADQYFMIQSSAGLLASLFSFDDEIMFIPFV